MAEPASKSLRRIALPLIISFTLRNVFSLVDLGFATSLENSPSAVGAISFWIPFQMFYIALWVGLSAGFTATLSQAFGVRRQSLVSGLRRAITRILIGLISALILLGIGLQFAVPLFGLEPDLAHDFTVYGTILAIGFPITGFWAILPDSIIKAHQDTRSTMIAGFLSTGTNATLNAIFVFVFGWGLAGIAIGTVVSRIPSLVYALVRARKLEAARLERWAEDPSTSEKGEEIIAQLEKPGRRIFELGTPSTFAFVLTALEASFVNTLLLALPDSTEKIASWGVFSALLQLSVMPIVGSAVAVLPWLARLVPEGRISVIRRELLSAAGLCAILSLLLTLLPAFVYSEDIARRILTKDGFVDPGSLALAIDVLRLLPIVALASLPFILLRTSFEALNHARLAVVASLLRFVLLSFPCLWIGREIGLETGLGAIRGMALGLAVSAGIASVFVVVAVHRKVRLLERS